MATPFTDPRRGRLYCRHGVPETLPATAKGLSGAQRLVATFLALDAAAGDRQSASIHEQI